MSKNSDIVSRRVGASGSDVNLATPPISSTKFLILILVSLSMIILKDKYCNTGVKHLYTSNASKAIFDLITFIV